MAKQEINSGISGMEVRGGFDARAWEEDDCVYWETSIDVMKYRGIKKVIVSDAY